LKEKDMSFAPGWRGTNTIAREMEERLGRRIGPSPKIISNMKKTKEQLKQEIADLEQQLEPLQKELQSIYEAEGENTEAKIKQCEMMKDKFSPDELRYAATSRCKCGAGLAYPKNSSPRGSWYCSVILTGQAERGSSHDSSFPFTFYEIKSEHQPSANGQTTRPKE